MILYTRMKRWFRQRGFYYEHVAGFICLCGFCFYLTYLLSARHNSTLEQQGSALVTRKQIPKTKSAIFHYSVDGKEHRLGVYPLKKPDVVTAKTKPPLSFKDTVVGALDGAINEVRNKFGQGKELLHQLRNRTMHTDNDTLIHKGNESVAFNPFLKQIVSSAKYLHQLANNTQLLKEIFDKTSNYSKSNMVSSKNVTAKNVCNCLLTKSSQQAIARFQCKCCVQMSLPVLDIQKHIACIAFMPIDGPQWRVNISYNDVNIFGTHAELNKSGDVVVCSTKRGLRGSPAVSNSRFQLPRLCATFRKLNVDKSKENYEGCVDFHLRWLEKDLAFYPMGCFTTKTYP